MGVEEDQPRLIRRLSLRLGQARAQEQHRDAPPTQHSSRHEFLRTAESSFQGSGLRTSLKGMVRTGAGGEPGGRVTHTAVRATGTRRGTTPPAVRATGTRGGTTPPAVRVTGTCGGTTPPAVRVTGTRGGTTPPAVRVAGTRGGTTP